MGTSIDADVSIFAGDKHQEVLAWLRENDEEGFDFDQPFRLNYRKSEKRPKTR